MKKESDGQQMVEFAKEQVRAYVDARAKAQDPAETSAVGGTADCTGKTARERHESCAKTKDPILENVQMKTFDVWTTNQPVMVFSAEAHMPPPAAGTCSCGC